MCTPKTFKQRFVKPIQRESTAHFMLVFLFVITNISAMLVAFVYNLLLFHDCFLDKNKEVCQLVEIIYQLCLMELGVCVVTFLLLFLVGLNTAKGKKKEEEEEL